MSRRSTSRAVRAALPAADYVPPSTSRHRPARTTISPTPAAPRRRNRCPRRAASPRADAKAQPARLEPRRSVDGDHGDRSLADRRRAGISAARRGEPAAARRRPSRRERPRPAPPRSVRASAGRRQLRRSRAGASMRSRRRDATAPTPSSRARCAPRNVSLEQAAQAGDLTAQYELALQRLGAGRTAGRRHPAAPRRRSRLPHGAVSPGQALRARRRRAGRSHRRSAMDRTRRGSRQPPRHARSRRVFRSRRRRAAR